MLCLLRKRVYVTPGVVSLGPVSLTVGEVVRLMEVRMLLAPTTERRLVRLRGVATVARLRSLSSENVSPVIFERRSERKRSGSGI